MITTPLPRAHYMKFGAPSSYCAVPSVEVQLAYDEWEKVTCSQCLNHPAAVRQTS